MEKEKLNTTDNTSIDDDKLLQEFFADSVSMCIADNGFSKRVMNQLPQTTVAKAKQMPKRQQIAYILWTVVCCVLVIVHTVMTDGLNVLANCLQKVAATTTLTVSSSLSETTLDSLLPSTSQHLAMPLTIAITIVVAGAISLYDMICNERM